VTSPLATWAPRTLNALGTAALAYLLWAVWGTAGGWTALGLLLLFVSNVAQAYTQHKADQRLWALFHAQDTLFLAMRVQRQIMNPLTTTEDLLRLREEIRRATEAAEERA
jgi:hypothetical protein